MSQQANKHAEVASKPLIYTKTPRGYMPPNLCSHSHSGLSPSNQTSIRRLDVIRTLSQGAKVPSASKATTLRSQMTREVSQVNPLVIGFGPNRSERKYMRHSSGNIQNNTGQRLASPRGLQIHSGASENFPGLHYGTQSPITSPQTSRTRFASSMPSQRPQIRPEAFLRLFDVLYTTRGSLGRSHASRSGPNRSEHTQSVSQASLSRPKQSMRESLAYSCNKRCDIPQFHNNHPGVYPQLPQRMKAPFRLGNVSNESMRRLGPSTMLPSRSGALAKSSAPLCGATSLNTPPRTFRTRFASVMPRQASPVRPEAFLRLFDVLYSTRESLENSHDCQEVPNHPRRSTGDYNTPHGVYERLRGRSHREFSQCDEYTSHTNIKPSSQAESKNSKPNSTQSADIALVRTTATSHAHPDVPERFLRESLSKDHKNDVKSFVSTPKRPQGLAAAVQTPQTAFLGASLLSVAFPASRDASQRFEHESHEVTPAYHHKGAYDITQGYPELRGHIRDPRAPQGAFIDMTRTKRACIDAPMKDMRITASRSLRYNKYTLYNEFHSPGSSRGPTLAYKSNSTPVSGTVDAPVAPNGAQKRFRYESQGYSLEYVPNASYKTLQSLSSSHRLPSARQNGSASSESTCIASLVPNGAPKRLNKKSPDDNSNNGPRWSHNARSEPCLLPNTIAVAKAPNSAITCSKRTSCVSDEAPRRFAPKPQNESLHYDPTRSYTVCPSSREPTRPVALKYAPQSDSNRSERRQDVSSTSCNEIERYPTKSHIGPSKYDSCKSYNVYSCSFERNVAIPEPQRTNISPKQRVTALITPHTASQRFAPKSHSNQLKNDGNTSYGTYQDSNESHGRIPTSLAPNGAGDDTRRAMYASRFSTERLMYQSLKNVSNNDEHPSYHLLERPSKSEGVYSSSECTSSTSGTLLSAPQRRQSGSLSTLPDIGHMRPHNMSQGPSEPTGPIATTPTPENTSSQADHAQGVSPAPVNVSKRHVSMLLKKAHNYDSRESSDYYQRPKKTSTKSLHKQSGLNTTGYLLSKPAAPPVRSMDHTSPSPDNYLESRSSALAQLERIEAQVEALTRLFKARTTPQRR